MNIAYPYPTLMGDIEITVRQVRVDGMPLPVQVVSRSEQAVTLHRVERTEWQEGSLDIEVTVPVNELADGPWAGVSCIAVLTEGATNARCVRPLTRSRATGTWSGTVPVLREAHHRRATLGVAVVADIGGVTGRLIGTAKDTWVVDLTAAAPVREREIDIVEVDFRDGPHDWLRPYKDAPWWIDTSGEMPTVLLNTSFEGITEMLNAPRGAAGRAAAALVANQIAGEAWTAMFHAAVADLELDEDGLPVVPDGWRAVVLRSTLPDVLPRHSLGDALVEIHNQRVTGAGWAELHSRVQYAVARRSRLPKNLTTAIRTVARLQEGNAR